MPQRTRCNANQRYLETDKTTVVVVAEKRWIGYPGLVGTVLYCSMADVDYERVDFVVVDSRPPKCKWKCK